MKIKQNLTTVLSRLGETELTEKLSQKALIRGVSFKINAEKKPFEELLTASYSIAVKNLSLGFKTAILDTETKSNISQIADYFTNPQKRWIGLLGNWGNGKTTMFHALNIAIKFMLDNGLSRMSEIPIYSSFELSNTENACYKKALNCYALCIDDLGKEPTEACFTTPTINILTERYRKGLFTCFTSNMKPDQIRPKYGSTVASRLNECLHMIEFKNKSYRGE